MNTELANNVIQTFGEPSFLVNNTHISFARQSKEDVVEIENMSDEDIVNEYKSLVWLNYIYGQVSVNELQRISLLDLEIETRENISTEELESWFEETESSFDESLYF